MSHTHPKQANDGTNSSAVIGVPTTEVVTDLARIGDHLATLYRRAAGADGEGATPVVRAILLNLVVFARTQQEADEAALNVSKIAGNHPCRAVILDMTPPQPGEPAGIVTAVCGITERGDRTLCGEIITLNLHPGASEVVGSVMPLLAPDVPVFAWAPGEIPVADADFDDLLRIANHVILDSRRFQNLITGLKLVWRYCPQHDLDCPVTDLAWLSVQPWRELTAQHFDPPGVREYLRELHRVDVNFAKGEREDVPPSAPLLFASWLMARTELKPRRVEHTGTGAFVVECDQDGRSVELHLSPTGRGLEPGRIGAVVVRGSRAGRTATFITKSVSMTGLVVTEECPGVCLPPQELDLPPQSDADLAATALDAVRSDPYYEEALVVAAEVLGLLYRD